MELLKIQVETETKELLERAADDACMELEFFLYMLINVAAGQQKKKESRTKRDQRPRLNEIVKS